MRKPFFSRQTYPSAGDEPSHAALVADQAIRGTQHAVNRALDGLVDGAQHVRDCAVPVVDRTADHGSELARRGVQAMRQGSRQLRVGARRRSEDALDFVRHRPLESLLFAAAAGAVAMWWLRRRARSQRASENN